jgi:uncharacterized heparinase superfamily protein
VFLKWKIKKRLADMIWLKRMILVIQTGKDLKPSQITARLVLSGKRILRRLRKAKVLHRLKLLTQPVLLQLSVFKGKPVAIINRANQALDHEYHFLNQTVKFEGEIDWQCPHVSRLWRFNLHYHAFISDLADAFILTGEPGYFGGMKQQLNSWIRRNRLQTGDGWCPYTISLRVINWIFAVSKCWKWFEADHLFREELLGSLWEQLRFLRRNLEFDTRGNHLFENLKALIIGGIFFGSNEKGAGFFHLGQKFLAGQLSEQILPDGGHCERSPMYHCIVLEGLLELFEVYRGCGLEPPVLLEPIIRKMLEFLKTMLFNDDSYPLFNDSAFGVALPPNFLIQWGQSLTGPILATKNNQPLDATGYVRLNTNSGGILLFNCGAPCPPFLPGHAHADTLSFEWRFDNGTRVFVDPGVYEYNTGLWRDYFRGTKAHNTVQIDDRNSSEVWGSFRTARKAKVRYSGLTETAQYAYTYGEHDGFSFLPGKPIHRREIFLFNRNVLLVIDTITGAGKHLIHSRLHLHPDWSAQVIHNRAANILDFTGLHHELRLQFFSAGNVSVHHGELDPILGWYSPSFNQRVPIFSVVYSTQVQLPYRTGFICYNQNSTVNQVIEANQIHLQINGMNIVFNLDANDQTII